MEAERQWRYSQGEEEREEEEEGARQRKEKGEAQAGEQWLRWREVRGHWIYYYY